MCRVHALPRGSTPLTLATTRVQVYFQKYPGLPTGPANDRAIEAVPWVRYLHGERVAHGTLSPDGMVEVPIPVGCDQVEIAVLGTRYQVLLAPAFPSPAHSTAALIARLRELGYYQHPEHGGPFPDGPRSLSAIERALLALQLDDRDDGGRVPLTGTADSDTVAALVRRAP